MTALSKKRLDLRDMLLLAGAGQWAAQMSIPYMNMAPGTTDPYTQGVIQLVQGLQRLLNQQGAKLEVDGGMGADTVAALVPFSGARWYDKSWAQLYADVISGKPWPGYIREDRAPVVKLPTATADYVAVGDPITDLVTNPFVLLAGGAFLYWKFFHKKAS
jgi:hypothetical protein